MSLKNTIDNFRYRNRKTIPEKFDPILNREHRISRIRGGLRIETINPETDEIEVFNVKRKLEIDYVREFEEFLCRTQNNNSEVKTVENRKEI